MGRKRKKAPSPSFLREHSLSLTLAALLVFFVLMYGRSDPSTHLGSFFGNAIADWLGVLVFVIASKYFFETGSGESKKPAKHFHERVLRLLIDHSLTLALALTGAVWVVVYARSDVDSRWGQVVGNIVSNWTQVLGLVIITKYAWETGSKEGQ
jgi:hypothetical protein